MTAEVNALLTTLRSVEDLKKNRQWAHLYICFYKYLNKSEYLKWHNVVIYINIKVFEVCFERH